MILVESVDNVFSKDAGEDESPCVRVELVSCGKRIEVL